MDVTTADLVTHICIGFFLVAKPYALVYKLSNSNNNYSKYNKRRELISKPICIIMIKTKRKHIVAVNINKNARQAAKQF